jgi:PAS domain S-box-containing protein
MSSESGLPEKEQRREEISVVYVDDYEELCELTAEGLEEASDRLAVETTTEPSAVTDRIEAVDCVVADYAMPDMDGLELLRRVRVRSEELPFILYTGKGDEAVASEAISLGVTDYLAKRGGPERFVRLAHRIENVVDARRAADEAEKTRTKARTAIERERTRLRALLEYSPTVTGVLDGTGRFEFLSPSIEEITGYTPRELRGEVAFEYVHEDDRERAERAFARVLESPRTTLSVEVRFREQSGGWRHVEVRGTNHLENPAVEGVIINARDLTERKRTDERLRRERDLTERVFEVTPSPLLLMDEDGHIRRMNDRAAEVFGMERSALQGHAPSESSVSFRNASGEEIVDAENLWEVVSHANRTVHDAECEVSLPSGDYELEVSAAPLPEVDEGFVVVAVETAERLS